MAKSKKQGNAASQNFMELLDQTVAILKKNNIKKIEAYNTKSLNYFSFLDSDKQKRILNNLEDFLIVCQEANQRGIKLHQTRKFLKFVLSRIGMHAPESIYDSIKDNDVVEAYNLEHLQIFRSLVFFELCHYTVADVLMHEWYDLYGRSEEVNSQIMNYAQRILKSDNDMVVSNIPSHNMSEIFSEPQGVFNCNYKFFSPLFSGPNNKTGMLCVMRAEEVGVREKPYRKPHLELL